MRKISIHWSNFKVAISITHSLVILALFWQSALKAKNLDLPRIDGAKPRSMIFILTDDHRWDAIGALGHPFIKTPHLDSMIHNGVHFENAFVNTSLCSPSRASILTGLYTHKHQVADNNHQVRPGLTYFSQYLQKAGYDTAFVGKWHMGPANANPRPGWDHWVSFHGQGLYYPVTGKPLNINGKEVPQKGYITDELTDYALDWLKGREDDEDPFMLYLSHKAVHSPFDPSERHAGDYGEAEYILPDTYADTPENYENKPRWLKNQRNSWHGVGYPYHRIDQDVTATLKRYCESFLAVDDSIGRILDYLKANDLYEDTIVIYMGDNGFLFGEHGLIDKRVAYEESIRVPLVMQCPELFEKGKVISKMVANIDIAPTILEAAGLRAPNHMDGESFLPLALGKDIPWRKRFLYEYYWEWNFPHTPTTFAIRTDHYKYIYYYGLWDVDELYDIKNDPKEQVNLAYKEEYQEKLEELRYYLFAELEASDGNTIPLKPIKRDQKNLRYRKGGEDATFPEMWMRDGNWKRPPMRKAFSLSKTKR